ncbi:MAG: ATP-dependent DNA ligase [archaeon]
MQYSVLCELYEKVGSTTKRLEKTRHIAAFLRDAPSEKIPIFMLLLQGRLFPSWDPRETGVAAKLVVKSLAGAFGMTPAAIEKDWSKLGDLGLVAEKHAEKKRQTTLFSQKLTVDDVFKTLAKVAELQGAGTVDNKTGLIKKLLTSATPIEAKYVIRTVLEELRAGVGSGTIRDAIVWASFPPVQHLFMRCPACETWQTKAKTCVSCSADLKEERKKTPEGNGVEVADPTALLDADLKHADFIAATDEKTGRDLYNTLTESVQHAYDLTNDFGEVARIAKEEGLKGLNAVTITPCKPLKVMLAQKVKGVEEGISRLGTPLEAEYKYDGFRMQVHHDGKRITIFTRRLEDVTTQFPDVVATLKNHVKAESYILDAEAVGRDPKTGAYRPFQEISQRIRRKYNIKALAEALPVELNIFDVLYLDGKSMLDVPFSDRRAAVERLVTAVPGKVCLAEKLIATDADRIESFYQAALKAGNEGLMLKKLDAPYKPGSRVGFMVKLKPTMDTLDVVVVGAEWGEGKRSSWLTSFSIAIVDDSGTYLEIGKVGTGIKELEGEELTFQRITDLLKPLIQSQKGREVVVRPEVVLEIRYEEIQKSPTYGSGFALRFPRVVGLREDRAPEEASTLDQVEDLFFGQN